jgi:hypothetical protein
MYICMYLHNNLINFLYRKQDESIKAKQIKKFSYLNPSQSTPGSQDQVPSSENLNRTKASIAWLVKNGFEPAKRRASS